MESPCAVTTQRALQTRITSHNTRGRELADHARRDTVYESQMRYNTDMMDTNTICGTGSARKSFASYGPSRCS